MEIAIIASLLSALLGFFIGNLSRKKHKIEVDSVQSKIHELEKKIHINERDHLEELNNIRKSHFNEINQVREASYKEGGQKKNPKSRCNKNQYPSQFVLISIQQLTKG